MICFVTGCAGFIGSNLTERLLNLGHEVVGIDNFTTGKKEFILNIYKNENFVVYPLDIFTNKAFLPDIMKGCDIVYHLAANADIRNGIDHPARDVEQNIIATHNILEGMRIAGIKHIVFSSTGSVYGEANIFPTPESVKLEHQTSLYSASKLACEGLIQAYCEGFGFTSYIYRFVSVLGKNYHHGHVFDFYKQLREHPRKLKILGNGTQIKSYLHVDDCINGIMATVGYDEEKINTYNIGTDETITVKDSARTISEHLGCSPEIEYGNGNRGWIGDNPKIFLDTTKIKSRGWFPKHTIEESIKDTLNYFVERDGKIKR